MAWNIKHWIQLAQIDGKFWRESEMTFPIRRLFCVEAHRFTHSLTVAHQSINFSQQ